MALAQNRHINQQNRIEPKNKLMPLQSIFDRGGKNMQWAKDSLFNKWGWENWTDTCREMNYTTLLHRTQGQIQNRLKT